MAQEREVQSWITIKHKHVPIFKGESVQDAVNRFKEKSSAKKEKIKQTAKKLNATGHPIRPIGGKTVKAKDWKPLQTDINKFGVSHQHAVCRDAGVHQTDPRGRPHPSGLRLRRLPRAL